MKHWQKLRSILLALTLGSALLVLGKTIAFPTPENRPISVFNLPARVSLEGWQFVSSRPLAVDLNRPALLSPVDEQTISGRAYRYQRNGVLLTVEVRYFVNSYIHVPAIVEESSLLSKKPNLTALKQKNTGFYMLFDEEEQTHLSACISASGGSTVTDRQFIQNQNSVEVLSNRLLPWLLGQAPLRDRRCLWVNLSVPLTASPQILEEVWTSHYSTWHRQFREF